MEMRHHTYYNSDCEIFINLTKLWKLVQVNTVRRISRLIGIPKVAYRLGLNLTHILQTLSELPIIIRLQILSPDFTKLICSLLSAKCGPHPKDSTSNRKFKF